VSKELQVLVVTKSPQSDIVPSNKTGKSDQLTTVEIGTKLYKWRALHDSQ